MTDIATESTPTAPTCIACSGPDPAQTWRPLFRIWRERPIPFFRCRRCGLIFKDPGVYRPEEQYRFSADPSGEEQQSLAEFHATFHTGGTISNERGELYSTFGYDQHELVSGIFDGVQRKIRRHSALTGESRFRLLEVGCATGFLLDRFRRGYPRAELVGVDPSPFSTREAKRLDGVTVHCGTLDGVTLEEASFDVVVMIGNFQLHRNPLATLGTAGRLLKPGGLLIFDTKNPASWFRRAGRVLSRLWPLNRFAAVRRLVNYSHTGMRYGIPKTLLARWLRQTGFEMLQLTTKDLRVFGFRNSRPVSRGVCRAIWNVLNTVDVLRDQRAWLDVCCRKRS